MEFQQISSKYVFPSRVTIIEIIKVFLNIYNRAWKVAFLISSHVRMCLDICVAMYTLVTYSDYFM